jgi:CSLREA domain-containing protein
VPGRRPSKHRVHAALPLLALAAAALLAAGRAGAATIVVNSTADTETDDGSCTLREAATAVNTDLPSGTLGGECAAGDGGVDVIELALPPGSTIVASAFPFVFSQSVAIVGPGSADLVITIGAQDRVMVFDGTSLAPLSFSLTGVTIRSGVAIGPFAGRFDDTGGGLAAIQLRDLLLRDVRFENNQAEAFGGGMAVDMLAGGTATLEDCVFDGNRVFSSRGGGGGGLFIDNPANTTISRSLFVGNSALTGQSWTAEDPEGGALLVAGSGTLSIQNSTFSGNRADGEGGAIAFGSTLAAFGPTVATELVALTVTDNSADHDGDYGVAAGGGIHTEWSDAIVTIRNSIVAGNTDSSTATPPGPDIVGTSTTLATLGYNWIGIRAGAGAVFAAGQPNTDRDWVGRLAAPLDPGLGPLADYGGPSSTHSPITSPLSPVIDAGSCDLESDQRGWSNPATGSRALDVPAAPDADDGCDIGAFEAFLPHPDTLFADGFEGALDRWSVVSTASRR